MHAYSLPAWMGTMQTGDRKGKPMDDRAFDKTHAFWSSVAADWRIQVGTDGDSNRQLNSDPVLWRFAGDVRGRSVLDAGCGTGYLTRQLHDRGARVTGVD